MEHRLTPAQIRGARGMLDWSIAHLSAVSRLSVAMINRIERNVVDRVPDDAMNTIKTTLENEGVRFLPDDGAGPGVRFKLLGEQ